MELTEVIKKYRDDHNISLRTFAKKCGCSYQYISKIEKHQTDNPSVEMMKKIANAMNIPVRELIIMLNTGKADRLPSCFNSPEEALLWLTDLPLLEFYGGNNIHKMEPETQLEFAREVLEYMKYLSGRKKESR